MRSTLAATALLAVAGCSGLEAGPLAPGTRAILTDPQDVPVTVVVRDGGPGSVAGERRLEMGRGTRVTVLADDAPAAGRDGLRRVRFRIDEGEHAGALAEAGRWHLEPAGPALADVVGPLIDRIASYARPPVEVAPPDSGEGPLIGGIRVGLGDEEGGDDGGPTPGMPLVAASNPGHDRVR